jgi:hypothetical protein
METREKGDRSMKYKISLTKKQLSFVLESLYRNMNEQSSFSKDFEDILDLITEEASEQDISSRFPEADIIRAWAMPNKYTFKIEPIKKLLKGYVSQNEIWIDPFAGFNSPAKHTNDLNPKAPTTSHCQALEFVRQFDKIDGILFDPPYSPRQIVECYKSLGLSVSQETTQNAKLYKEVKDEAASRMRSGSIAISFGWNSVGFGKQRGFFPVEILIVYHGAAHNDTIVVVEEKE